MSEESNKIWNSVELLEKEKDVLERELEKANKIGGVFTLNAELALGKMKSRLAELKGEKRNIAKCSGCGQEIDLDHDFGCFKDGDNYNCMSCAIHKFMGIKRGE